MSRIYGDVQAAPRFRDAIRGPAQHDSSFINGFARLFVCFCHRSPKPLLDVTASCYHQAWIYAAFH